MLFLFQFSGCRPLLNACFFDLLDDFMAVFVTTLVRQELDHVVSDAVCERAE
jgi:hypothetical protein